MKGLKLIGALTLLLLTATSWAQSWAEEYDAALNAAARGEWSAAREKFLAAAALRPEDQSEATRLPGPVTERRNWRNGAPYSPNFGAAYAAYKAALSEGDDATREGLLKTAALELSTLISKGQRSNETFFILNQIYIVLQDTAMQREVEEQFKNGEVKWRVDTAFLNPEESAAIRAFSGQPDPNQNQNQNQGAGVTTTVVNANNQGGTTTAPANPASRVQIVPTKFALVIGNAQTRLSDGKVDFAEADALLIRDSLVQHAGYDEANVEVVTNATAEQIRTRAAALAERMGDDATLFVFFSGNGFNIDGRDFIAGVDTGSATDTSSMIGKVELLQPFIRKGARIFSFYQVARPKINGRFFGSEVPIVGAISQMNGTIEGQTVTGIPGTGGQVNGLFARSIASVLRNLRSNAVPISEFGWMVFNDMRGGRVGVSGLGGAQTPTLPTVRNLPAEASF